MKWNIYHGIEKTGT